jgi:hypothetical protein
VENRGIDPAAGRGDAAAIGHLITLHNLQFALSKKSMPTEAQVGSNRVERLLATLWQAAEEHGQYAVRSQLDAHPGSLASR